MTARSMWKGALTIGLITIPSKLYLATESKDAVSFNMLCPQDLQRIRMPVVCDTHGEIQRATTIKGFEWSKGQYVVVDDQELEALKLPSTRAVEITRFVTADEYVGETKQTYYLAPEEVGTTAFALLHDRMLRRGLRGIAKIMIRARESLCEVSPGPEGVMRLTTLYWPDEVRNPEGLGRKVPPPAAALVTMADQLIDGLTGPFDPTEFRDTYKEAVLELIENKLNGTTPAPAPAPVSPVQDLMAALAASVEKSKGAEKPKRERKEKKTA